MGKLSQKIPDLHSTYFHNKSRQNWPDKCKEVKNLLSNKGDFYKICSSKENIPKYQVFNEDCHEISHWLMNSFAEGVVLKPINGHRMNNIFKYFVEDNALYFEFLRNKKRQG